MATITAPQFAPFARPGHLVRPRGEKSAYQLVLTYALIYPLIFFAVRGSFSFEAMSYNNPATQSFYTLVNPDAGKGSALHSAEMLLCYGLVVMAMLPLWQQLLDACLQNLIAFAMPVWAILSTAWSQSPKRTLLFALMAFVHTIFAIYLPVRFKPKQLLQIFLLVGTVAALGSIAITGVLPRAGIDHKNAMIGVEGLYPHKNICSLVTIALMMPAFFYKFKGKSALLKKSTYLFLTTILVLATTSRTGWLVLLGCLGFIFIAKNLRRMKPLSRLMTVLFVPGIVLSVAWVLVTYMAQIAVMMGKDPSLSGRTVIWHAVFLSIAKRPWTGFGYDAFWTGTGEALRLAIATGDPALGNAENGVLQLWLELGLVGILILLALMFRSTRNAVRCYRAGVPDYAIWYMSMLFIAVLSLVDGDKFMYPHSIEWTMLILADVGLAQQAKRVLGAKRT